MAGCDDIDDFKSTGSVLEKLSLFEKLEQRQVSTAAAVIAKTNSITTSTPTTTTNDTQTYAKRNDDLSKSIRSIDKDPGMKISFKNQKLIKN